MKKYVVALDQGTTSSRCVLFDKSLNPVMMRQKEFRQIFPQPGWVEHDPLEIFSSQYSVLTELIALGGIDPCEIAAVGITNQRETTVVWDRNTGKPVCNAIVWQCRRTGAICDWLKKQPIADYIRENTGLVIDAYFSGTKLKWILDNIEGARERAENGDLLFGTVDSWLLWKLTGGRVHATDRTNASRTMLYNIRTHEWDKNILSALGIPECMLPEVCPSGHLYGTLNLFGTDIPICGIAGDQQSALFGQGCFNRGETKNTYGTGCFLLMNTGSSVHISKNGLISTVAATLDGENAYALEGSVFTAGALIQWLRDELMLIHDAADSEYFAGKVSDSGGVYIVPAFTGLGAPYWDMYARGIICGLTRGTGRNHIIRAALEAIAYQTADLLDAMQDDTGIPLSSLRVDGGACANNLLMQFQSDILGIPVVRPAVRETTALGAAMLAGLSVGFYGSKDDIVSLSRTERVFAPSMDKSLRLDKCNGWRKAVERTLSNAEEHN